VLVEDKAGWQEAGRASALESGAGVETWFEQGAEQAGRPGLSAAPTAAIVAGIVMEIGEGKRRSGLGGGWAGCGCGGVAELAGGIDYSAAGAAVSRIEKELSKVEI
jgi:hypothetical protein